jgi:hypothetical protein
MTNEEEKLTEMLIAVMEKTEKLYKEGVDMDDRMGDGMIAVAETVHGIPGLRSWWKEQKELRESGPNRRAKELASKEAEYAELGSRANEIYELGGEPSKKMAARMSQLRNEIRILKNPMQG